MEPKLAFTYNSKGGNGLLGMGWGLSGLSAITRCPRTLVQDGVPPGGINYNANDRFCLDGQRLVMITGASYGADGVEYRTERETFTKIISHGQVPTPGSGPQWFQVWTKAGQILEYGNTGDSQIEAQNKSTVRLWALDKISDRKGNYLAVTYAEDNANGDSYPTRIDYNYTGTPPTPSASVLFIPETARPDVTPAYVAGSVIKTLNRLAYVRTYVGPNLVKEYRLTYDNGEYVAFNGFVGRSRLVGITECDKDGNCLAGTTLGSQNAGTGLTIPDYTTPALPATLPGGAFTKNSVPAAMWRGDFNGDGKTDYMWVPSNGDGRWLIAYATGTGFTIPDYNTPALPAKIAGGFSTANANGIRNGVVTGVPMMFVGDFNGDGKTDYMWAPPEGDGRWLIAYATGTGFTLPNYTTPALPATIAGGFFTAGATAGAMFVRDFNGDGMTDYMWAPSGGDGRWLIAYATGTGFTIPNYNTPALPGALPGGFSTAPLASTQWEFLGDFNGDGMTDYMWVPSNGDGRWLIAYATGTGLTIPDYNTPALPATIPGAFKTQGQRMFVGDFNGDGKTDYMWVPSNGDGRWLIAYATGIGLTIPDYTLPALPATIPGGFTTVSGNTASQGWFLGDFNGDGKTDYMWTPSNGNGSWFIAYAKSPPKQLGDAGFVVPNTPALSATLPASTISTTSSSAAWRFVGDFNGDGKTDYMWVPSNGDGRFLVASANTPFSSPDFLSSIADGSSTQTTIAYKPLTDNTVYTKGVGAVYPVVDLQIPLYVVSSTSTSDGIGGTYVTNYKYSSLKAHQQGGGLLGFSNVQATDTRTSPGITTTTSFRQDYPFQGLVSGTSKVVGTSPTLIQVLNTWGTSLIANGTGKYHRCDLTNSVETDRDTNGVLLRTVTTNTTYDGYGNATAITVSTGDGYSKTTTNTYAPADTVNWLLSRPISSQVTSTTP